MVVLVNRTIVAKLSIGMEFFLSIGANLTLPHLDELFQNATHIQNLLGLLDYTPEVIDFVMSIYGPQIKDFRAFGVALKVS